MTNNIRFDFSYNHRDTDTSDDIFSININFENPKSSEEIAKNVQKFLDAIGYSNITVVAKTPYGLTPEAQGYYPVRETDDSIPF